MATFELSSKKYKNGRRPFTAILYELQPPECVVEDFGTKFNKNGITFLEEYCSQQLDSIKDMSVTVEFIDEERTQILGHGLTGTEDGMPTFDNATVIGHFSEGYISDVEINGETKRVVMGKGYLDEMRYHAFIECLETDLANGTSIEGSIEIYKSEGNEGIVYKKGGYPDEGRIPMQFIHSGWSMVLNPADTTSTLIELNSKNNKEETTKMDEKELKELIQTTISETNSKNDELNAQIAELNSQLEAKDTTISELNASVEQLQATLKKLEDDQRTYWEEREILEKELAKAKVAEKLAELDSALSEFNEDEKKCAEEDIENLKANLNACKKEDNACGDKKEMSACKKELDNATSEINSIVDKICRNIVTNQKKAEAEAVVAEQNSVKEQKETEVVDIFSEMCSETQTEDEDVNIF